MYFSETIISREHNFQHIAGAPCGPACGFSGKFDEEDHEYFSYHSLKTEDEKNCMPKNKDSEFPNLFRMKIVFFETVDECR